MCTEVVVSGTVVDGEKGDEEDGLCLFGNSISVDIFYAFQHYRRFSGSDDIA